MTLFESRIRQVLEDLQPYGPFAVVGGLAVAVRTRPRFTADVDVVVTVADDAAAESLVRALQQQGYILAAAAEQDAQGRLAHVRMVSDDEVGVDLLFASSGIEAEAAAAAEVLEIYPALHAPVATIGHLLALKVLALAPDREHDARDIAWLLREASESDVEVAVRALSLIEQRDFHRNKDLQAEFASLRERFARNPVD